MTTTQSSPPPSPHQNTNVEPAPPGEAHVAPETPAGRDRPRRGIGAVVRHVDVGPFAVLAGIVVIWVFFQTQNSNFLSARNLSNLSLQMAVTGILAIGVVMVMIAGEIDLSLGSITGASGALLGVLLTEHGWPPAAAVTVTVLFALCAGLVQGLVTVLIGVPSFLVTLGGYLAFFGVQLALVGSAGEIRIANPSILAIANNYLPKAVSWVAVAVVAALIAALEISRRRAWAAAQLPPPPLVRSIAVVAGPVAALIVAVGYLNRYLGVPYLLIILLALMVALGWVTRRTTYGRHLYAVGGNVEGARRAGIRTGAIRVSVLTLSGTLAGLAGVVSASRLYAVDANLGGGTLLLEAIAAAVIGGTSLFGGRGRIFHALLGATVIESIENGLDLLGKSASTKNIATGVILVLAVCIDAVNRRRAGSRP